MENFRQAVVVLKKTLRSGDADKDEVVRSAAAQNYSIDAKTYNKLASDTVVVRQVLALNGALTNKQKIQLTNDACSLVRQAVVANYRGVSKYFWQKVLNSDESIRAYLATRSG